MYDTKLIRRFIMQNLSPDFSILLDHWPSPFVARHEIAKLTGGIINPRYLANLDSLGRGPKGRIKVGRKVVYPVSEVAKWLESRSSIL